MLYLVSKMALPKFGTLQQYFHLDLGSIVKVNLLQDLAYHHSVAYS